jgi:hypothetical protein
MSALAMAERVHAQHTEASDRSPSLDRLIAGAWTQLVAHRAVECPLCGEQMAPKYGAHALPIGGRCLSCGTELT